MEYYSAIKDKEILPFAITWMSLEDIMRFDNYIITLILDEVLHSSLLNIWSPSKYFPSEAMHPYQHLVHPSK